MMKNRISKIIAWSVLLGVFVACGQCSKAADEPVLTTLRAATGLGVRNLALSPDGSTLAVVTGAITSFMGGEKQGRVQLLDARTGALQTEIGGKDFPDLQSVAFSPDGNLLALGNRNSSHFEVWDLTAHKVKWDLRSHSESVAFSPDGKVLAAAGQLWDAVSGHQIKGLSSAEVVAFSSDGRWLAGANWNYVGGRPQTIVTIWNARTWELHKTLTGILGRPATLTFSPDGNTLAVDSGDYENEWEPGASQRRRDPNRAQLWDVASGQLLREFIHVASVQALAFEPSGSTLLGVAGSVRRWNVANGKLLAVLPQRDVTTLTLATDGKIFLGYSDGTIRAWNGQGIRLFEEPSTDPARHLASMDEALDFSPNSKELVAVERRYTWQDSGTAPGTALGDALLGFWNIENAMRPASPDETNAAENNRARKPDFTLPVPWTVTDIAYSPDGKWLAAGSEQGDRETPFSGNLTIWERSSGATRWKPAAKVDISGTRVMRVGFRIHRMGRHEMLVAAAWCTDYTVRLFNPRSGKSLGTLPRGAVLKHFSFGNRAVAGAIVLPERYRKTKFHLDKSVYSTRANMIAVGITYYSGERKVVLLRPPAKGQRFHRFLGEFDAESWDLAFSPDGHWLAATGSNDGAQLWNVRTRRLERRLTDGSRLEFSANGEYLAIGSRSYGVTLYHLPGLNLGTGGLRLLDEARVHKLHPQFPNSAVEKKWFEEHPALHQIVRPQPAAQDESKLSVTSRALSTDRKTLALAWLDQSGRPPQSGILVRAVNQTTNTYRDKFAFAAPWGQVSQLSLSRDGAILASGDVIYEGQERVGRQVRVWDLKTGKLLQTFAAPGAGDFSVAVSPNGKLVAAATAQPGKYQIRIWDIARGVLVRLLSEAPMGGIEFSSDGRSLRITNGAGDNGSVWSLD
jgi:WD40 repeat protein